MTEHLSLCYKRQSVTTCLIFCPEPRKIAGVLRLVGYFLKWRVKALFFLAKEQLDLEGET